jgi:transcriptional regulator with XRE-family HTH domain
MPYQEPRKERLDTKMQEFVGLLRNKQAELGLSDRKFAEQIDVSHNYWNMVRRGLQRPGNAILAAVLRQFPDLTDSVIEYMTDNVLNYPTTSRKRTRKQSTEE